MSVKVSESTAAAAKERAGQGVRGRVKPATEGCALMGTENRGLLVDRLAWYMSGKGWRATYAGEGMTELREILRGVREATSFGAHDQVLRRPRKGLPSCLVAVLLPSILCALHYSLCPVSHYGRSAGTVAASPLLTLSSREAPRFLASSSARSFSSTTRVEETSHSPQTQGSALSAPRRRAAASCSAFSLPPPAAGRRSILSSRICHSGDG